MSIDIQPNDLGECLIELGELETSSPETARPTADRPPRHHFPQLSIEQQVELAKRLRGSIEGCKAILENLPRKAELLKAILEDQLERIERHEEVAAIFDLRGRQSSVKLVHSLAARANRSSLPIEDWQLRPSYVLELASRIIDESSENPRLNKLCSDSPDSRLTAVRLAAASKAVGGPPEPAGEISSEPLEQLRLYVQSAEDALELLTQTFQRLVTWIAKRYRHPQLSLEDLISEGNQGLMKGLERYDPERGTEPSTFLFYPVREAILVYQRSYGHAVKYPPNLLHLRNKIARVQEEAFKNEKPPPGVTELADALKASPERILEALSIQLDLNLGQPISDSEEATHQDLISGAQDQDRDHPDEIVAGTRIDQGQRSFGYPAESITDAAEKELSTEEDAELRETLRQFMEKFSGLPARRRRVWELFRSATGKWQGEVNLQIVRRRGSRGAEIKAIAQLRATEKLKFIS